MGDGHLDVVAPQVDDGVERLAGEVLGEQVEQAVARVETLAVERDGEPRVEVGVVAQHGLDDVFLVGVGGEERIVGREGDVRAVLLARGVGHDAGIGRQLPPLEGGAARLPVAEGLHREGGGEGVDGLRAHAVQPDGLLERLGVELAARVHDGNHVGHLAQRNAASEVAHLHRALVQAHVDAAPRPHAVFVDGVVYHFLEQHVDAVVGVRAVAQLADVHADVAFVVCHGGRVVD